MVVSGKNTMELIIAARDRTGAAFSKVTSRVGKLGGVSKKVTAALKGAAKAGALIGGAAVIAGIVGSTKAFMDFEDAMANVRKTTGLTKEQIGVLGEAINSLALKIPVAQTELAGIAATAGQLGIVGQKNILSFTETVAKMTTAFDMSADSVAIAMAKLTNIYDIPIEQVGNLGSAINVLGNTTAASESQLMAFSMALGPTGRQLGFTATEALSLGASMVSIGMDASAAGTRLSRAFSMIGQNLDELAGFMGVSTEEFTASFEEMPMETFMGVLEKLSQVEGKLKANTIASELFNEIGAKAIKGLTGDLDGLKKNLDNSAEGFEANVSLNEEFAAKTDTLKARFQLLKNSISSLLIDIGGELAPTLNQVIESFRNILPAVKDLVFEIGSGFSEMFESIGRQAGGTLDPLIKKIKEAGDKISSGLNFKTLLDDIGVFIGAALNPLIRGFTWLIDKLGPLWDLLGKGASAFHSLANALKTEEGKLDDIFDATEKVVKAKQDLFDINERLRGDVETLAEALEKAGGWTTILADLEAAAKVKTDALAVARLEATEAIALHGAESEIAKTAIENVKIAEEAATTATNTFNTSVSTATGAIIDGGVATEGLQKAQLDFAASTDEAASKQGELETAIIDLEKELEEAKQAPFDLGEAFSNFGKRVASIFLDIPLQIAEAIVKVQDIIAGGLNKIGLGSFGKKLDADTENIKAKIEIVRKKLETDIEDPLSKDIPKASEEMKEAITDGMNAIVTSAKRVKEGAEDATIAIEDAGEAGEDGFKKVEIAVDKATGKVTVLTDDLGDTADTFNDNAEAAQTLLDLDWDIFTKLENDLPNINSGIGDMTSAFKDLDDVLEANMENLKSVRESVEDINEVAAPFIEEGFLKGIKSIGTFANSLKDAGNAINTFSNLQEISIKGMINFSLHVNDMVSALHLLDSQMEDLRPSFEEMNTLIESTVDSFIWSGGRKESVAGEINRIGEAERNRWKEFNSGKHSWEEYVASKPWDAINAEIKSIVGWKTGYAVVHEYQERYIKGEEDIIDITKDLLNTSYAITHQMDKQTGALAQQTGELNKITEALAPYLDFMRTLNELAVLSALSTDQLNNGLDAITGTLGNLGEALSTFDLDSTLKELFGTKMTEGDMEGAFTGGFATPLLNVLKKFEVPFNNLVEYITRLSSAISGLVSAFDSLATVGDSVLADQIKIKEVFGSIASIMSNFSKEMGDSGFGEKLAKGFEEMLTSASPLIRYFKENNAGVVEFNTTLLTFKATLSNVVSVMDSLKRISEITIPSVKDLSAGFDTASKTIGNFDEALMKHMGISSMGEGAFKVIDAEAFKSNFVTVLHEFSKGWALVSEAVGDSIETFKEGAGMITDLVSSAQQLSDAFEGVSESIVISSVEMEAGLGKASESIANFDEALMKHMGISPMEDGAFKIIDVEAFKSNFVTMLNEFSKGWALVSEAVGESFEMFGEASTTIGGMINDVLSLSAAFTTLGTSTMASAKDMERAMRNVDVFISSFTEVMQDSLGSVVDKLTDLDVEWKKHSDVMADIMPSFKESTSNISALISTVTSLNAAFKTLSETSSITSVVFNKGFAALITTIKNFATALSKNVGPMIESFKQLRAVWIQNEAVLVPLMLDFIIITKNLKSVADAANNMTASFKRINSGWVLLERGFDRLVAFIKTTVAAIKEFYTPEAAAEVSAFIKDIGTVIESFVELNSKIEGALNDIRTKIGSAVSDIGRKISSLENLKSVMFSSGANLIGSFIDGINSMHSLLVAALIAVANTVKAYLGVSSPTELGALKDLEQWPKNLVRSFSKGIEAEMGSLNVSLGSMVAPAVVSEGGGSSNRTSVSFTIHQNIKDRATADYSNRELEKLLKRHTPK